MRPSQTLLWLSLLVLLSLGGSTLALPGFRTPPAVKKTSFVSAPFGGGSVTNKPGKQSHAQSAKDDRDDNNPEERLGFHLMLPKSWARLLYVISAFNPFLAVFHNDYSKMVDFQSQQVNMHMLAKTYETLFFFAKLKPRVSFAVGAGFRALQLTTAFQYVFDPTIGVGLGLNILCLYAKSRWPATIVLGWCLSKPLWKIVGASPPAGLPVPIKVSWKEHKDAPVATKGYRIGPRG